MKTGRNDADISKFDVKKEWKTEITVAIPRKINIGSKFLWFSWHIISGKFHLLELVILTVLIALMQNHDTNIKAINISEIMPSMKAKAVNQQSQVQGQKFDTNFTCFQMGTSILKIWIKTVFDKSFPIIATQNIDSRS